MTSSDPTTSPSATTKITRGTAIRIVAFFSSCLGVSLIFFVLAAIGVGLALNYFDLLPSSKAFLGIKQEETAVPPGSLTAFDPITSMHRVLEFAGPDAQFVSMSATFVGLHGTVDLTPTELPRPEVVYRFVREVSQSEHPASIGAGAGEDGKQWQDISVIVGSPGARTQARRMNGMINAQYQYKNLGMKRRIGLTHATRTDTPILPPACPLDVLWKSARDHGAPENAVASIEYGARGYSFWIRDTRFRYQFNTTCQLIQQ
jgi:hypothetical protein